MLMAAEERWYFTKEEINNSPSRRCGIDAEKELSYRQQGANLIQDMGQRLQVNQLAINTAIVYMHRFYMYHPFTRFHRNSIAPAALFLAAKVEEQPRKLEHVIKVAYHCLFRDHPPLDTQSEAYLERAQELVVNENILLQTLGFDVAIDHPHTHVVKCCQLVRATKDLAQTSYFMATSSLHMTTMCLQYKPTVVACVCIYIVCTWSHYEIQRATEGKDWFWYVDKSVTLELLETLTAEFLAILDKCPNRLKKIMNSSQHTDDRSKSSQGGSSSSSLSSSRAVTGGSSSSVPSSRSHDHNSHNKSGVKVPQSQPHQHPQPPKLNLKEYNEKREKERREREKMRDRDVVDPREGRQFTLVSTSHSSQSAPPSTVATIASSHSLHSVLPSSRGKSSKGSSGRSSHPEHAKASAAHSTNHKTHGHGTTNQGSRGDAQPPLEALRVGTADARQDQRREISARSDSDRFDKSNRTSSSVVDGRLPGHETKPSVSDIRQHHVVDIKHSRQSLDAAVLERKSEIKHEQRMAERKPPEPKLEQVKVKTDIKTEIKTEIKEEKTSDTKSEAKEYNTIFHNSDMSDFTLNDFLSDNNFLNLNDGPPDELFDNSDSETKPDVSTILEDKNLLPQPAHQKSKSPGASQQQQQQQQVQQTQHQQHHTSSSNTAGVVSNASSNGEQRVSDSATAAPNYHNPRYHSATNGSVPPPQPTQTTPQHSSKSSSGSKRSRESERRNSERGEAELVPMVTKLEDTKYRTALSDPATPIKVRAEAQNLAMANATSKPTAATHSAPAPAVPEPVQKNPSEHVLRMKLPRPDHLKESQPDPTTVLMVGGVAGTEHKKHKHDHPHHKHKEKKKHKHKDKDKHKDREHKEHKEHKKEKKHKKHKDKDKERDRSRPGEDAGSAPIKITIAKDKVLYTPEPGSVPLRTHSTTATPVAPPINTTSANTTPSIPKFKIQKSRLKQKDLFGGTSSTSPESSPAGDLARDTPTTSLKIKISRDRLRPEKESKKRDRDRSPGDIQAAKVPRNGSEARSTHASPQVGAGHYRQQDVRGNAHHRQYSQQQQQVQQQPPPLPPHTKQMMHLQGTQAQYPRAPLAGAPPPPSAGVVPMIQPGPYSYQQFYPQYSIPPPNFSYPPPPYHHPPPMPYMQAPPPAFMTGHPPMPHSTASSNPPLPAEPPPPTPPPPPPE